MQWRANGGEGAGGGGMSEGGCFSIVADKITMQHWVRSYDIHV